MDPHLGMEFCSRGARNVADLVAVEFERCSSRAVVKVDRSMCWNVRICSNLTESSRRRSYGTVRNKSHVFKSDNFRKEADYRNENLIGGGLFNFFDDNLLESCA